MRTRSDKMMAAGGLSTILAQTLFVGATPTQFTVMVLGILLILAALSGLGRRLQPEKPPTAIFVLAHSMQFRCCPSSGSSGVTEPFSPS